MLPRPRLSEQGWRGIQQRNGPSLVGLEAASDLAPPGPSQRRRPAGTALNDDSFAQPLSGDDSDEEDSDEEDSESNFFVESYDASFKLFLRVLLVRVLLVGIIP